MMVSHIHRFGATPEEACPEGKISLNILIAIKFDAARRFGRAGKRGQRRLRIRAREHVEGLNADAPQSAHVHDFISESFVLKPSPLSFGPLLHDIALIAATLRAVPCDCAVVFVFSPKIRAMLTAGFENQPLLLERKEVICKMFSEKPGKYPF